MAALIFSMALSPLMIHYNGSIVKWLFADTYLRQRDQLIGEVAQDARDLKGHVI